MKHINRRYIMSADWHIRASSPRIRKDDYAETQFEKIKWILEMAEDLDADVLVSGDMFDAPRCPLWLLNRYTTLFKGFRNRIFTMPGQHDLHFHHPDLENTPLGNFLASDAVDWPKTSKICAVEFGGEVPEVKVETLMLHMAITPGPPPFFMPDAISAEQAIRDYGDRADLIVSGDYHDGFCEIAENCILVNAGPIMRASKDKMDYVPKIYFYNDGGIEEIPIPIKSDVFDLKALEDDSRKDIGDALRELASAIKVGDRVITKFKDVVTFVLDELESSPEARDIVMDIVNSVKSSKE